jgi:AcrR family transcriptional regulator
MGSGYATPVKASTEAVGVDAVRTRRGGRSARIREAVLAAACAQLADVGYSGLSPSAVAARAGVDRATLYRRWPTRARLAADAVMELAQDTVRVPGTGQPHSDLRAFAAQIAELLSAPETVRLIAALAVARAEDPELQDLAGAFWRTRFDAVAPLFRDASPDKNATREQVDRAIETLIAPLYFRALLSGQPIDDRLIDDSVATALATMQRG